MAPQERKRRREDSENEAPLAKDAESVYRTLREVFPTKSWRYLRDKAVNWNGGQVEQLIEQLLMNEGKNEEACDNSVIVLDDSVDLAAVAGGSAEDTNNPDDDSNIVADNSICVGENENILTHEVPADVAKATTSGYMENNYATLLAIFSDVSPIFLQEQAWSIGDNPSKLEAFISNSLERKSSLPSRKEYERDQKKKEAELKVRNMTVKDLLSEYDDPHQHFSDASSAVGDLYKAHALFYITKHFPTFTAHEVEKVMEQYNGHFVPSIKQIEEMSRVKKGKKLPNKSHKNPVKPQDMDLNFLKEYIYFKMEPRIRKFQAKEKAKRGKAIDEARKVGGLIECQVCFDDECLVAEVAMCEAGCMFCRDCVRRGAGVQIGDNKADIACLVKCGENIPLAVLQTVLTSKMYSRIVERKQMEEVKAAGIEDLVQCPACSFATIMPDPEDKLVTCGNQECGKVTCRLCGEESHVPLSCDEVEKDGEVMARTKLEDAMTEAMVRACVKCNKRFFKEEGCNKMKCECGQSMCYLCRQPVGDDYQHFYAQGASPLKGKCPLWSDNTNLHRAEIVKAAEEAKKSVDAKKLKYDPTKNLVKPPTGFDPNALHMAAAGYGEDSDSDEEDDDDFLDDEEDDDYWDYRRGRRIFDDFAEESFEDGDEEDEVDHRPYDWM